MTDSRLREFHVQVQLRRHAGQRRERLALRSHEELEENFADTCPHAAGGDLRAGHKRG